MMLRMFLDPDTAPTVLQNGNPRDWPSGAYQNQSYPHCFVLVNNHTAVFFKNSGGFTISPGTLCEYRRIDSGTILSLKV